MPGEYKSFYKDVGGNEGSKCKYPVRLDTYIPEFVDLDRLNAVKCDKIQVEFLRVNNWIQKWFDIDYSPYVVKQSGYRHRTLEDKKNLIKGITGFKYVSVCEDETQAYEYWRDHFNPSPDDCCNLRMEHGK